MEHGVYVMRNDFHKEGIYKIGKTDREATTRAREIQGGETGTPGTLRVVAFYPCSEPERLERMLHRHFSSQRVDPRREFFEVSLETVHEAVHELMDVSYRFSDELDYKAELQKTVKNHLDTLSQVKRLGDRNTELIQELREAKAQADHWKERYDTSKGATFSAAKENLKLLRENRDLKEKAKPKVVPVITKENPYAIMDAILKEDRVARDIEKLEDSGWEATFYKLSSQLTYELGQHGLEIDVELYDRNDGCPVVPKQAERDEGHEINVRITCAA